MVIFLRFVFETIILLGCIQSAYGQTELAESSTYVTSDSQCYGDGAVVDGTCPVSTSIALNNIRVGVQLKSDNCSTLATAGDGSGCCNSSTTACEFDFPITDNKRYHEGCNGRQSCTLGAERALVDSGSCNASLYETITQYMFFQYYCIEDGRITDTSGQNSAEDAALYLHNPGYPTSDIPAMTESACSVETDNCNAVIGVYVIERNLAYCLISTHFNLSQSLSIVEADGSVLVNWTCQDNTYVISQPIQSSENYLTVNLTSTMATTGGRFWIGFKATQVANLTINCPAQDRQYCLPTTSTTTSTQATSTLFVASSTASSTDMTNPSDDDDDSTYVVIVAVIVSIVVVASIVAAVVVVTLRKRKTTDKRQAAKIPHSSEAHVDETLENHHTAFEFTEVTDLMTNGEVMAWMTANDFIELKQNFRKYTGKDLLGLSKDDLKSICGAADGIRLFNRMRQRTLTDGGPLRISEGALNTHYADLDETTRDRVPYENIELNEAHMYSSLNYQA